MPPSPPARRIVRKLGRVEYGPVWEAMQRFTDERTAATPDEIWVLEHEPVFTLGMNADPAHVLAAGDIPVLRVDRGGQVTYHGPGQLVVYLLLDLRRAGLGVRDLVTALERSVIDCLASYGLMAEARPGAPGVYVSGRKIASVGIRIRRGASYHGLGLNVDVDLQPFTRINPCGHQGLEMTRLSELGAPTDLWRVADDLLAELDRSLSRTPHDAADNHALQERTFQERTRDRP